MAVKRVNMSLTSSGYCLAVLLGSTFSGAGTAYAQTPEERAANWHDRTLTARAGLGIGVGGAGPGFSESASIELPVSTLVAVGLTAGALQSSRITINAGGKHSALFGGASFTVSDFGPDRDHHSQLFVSFAAGLGGAGNSWEEGDCDFAIFDDGVEDPPCEWKSKSGAGLYVGVNAGWLYLVGPVGLGFAWRADVVAGSSAGTGGLTLTGVTQVAF